MSRVRCPCPPLHTGNGAFGSPCFPRCSEVFETSCSLACGWPRWEMERGRHGRRTCSTGITCRQSSLRPHRSRCVPRPYLSLPCRCALSSTIWQLGYSLDCRLRPPCGAIVSEFRPRVHVAGHEGDATSPAPSATPRDRSPDHRAAELGAKTPFSAPSIGSRWWLGLQIYRLSIDREAGVGGAKKL